MKWTSKAHVAPLALIAAVATFGMNAAAAYRLDDEPDQLPIELPVFSAGEPSTKSSDEQFLTAIERNPFNPARARTAARFGAAGSAAPQPLMPPPPPPVMLRLVGTTAFGGGKGIATIEMNGQPARTLRLGDSIAGFILRKVERAHAELRLRDSTVVLKFTNQD